MPALILQNDQAGATGRNRVLFRDGITPTEMLMQEMPNGINPDCTQIFINGKKVSIPDGEELFKPLFNKDSVMVINEVKGVVAAAYWAIAAVVAAVAISAALAPSIPGNAGEQKQSPNNTLQGQTNVARLNQAYPLIFGSPRSYPDLGGEAITEYVDNQKILTQFMCIGVGTFDIDEVRAGETPLENFSGASYTITEPVNGVTTIPELVVSFETNEIDGQELLGTNEGVAGDEYADLATNTVGTTSYEGTFFQIAFDQDATGDDLKAAFDAAVTDFIVEIDYARWTNQNGVPVLVAAVGTGTITAMDLVTDVGGDYYQLSVTEFNGLKSDVSATPPYSGPYTITEKFGAIVGPINTQLPCQELWFNIIFKRGLKGTVDIRIETQQLDGLNGDPVGSPVETDISYTENTLSEQYFTHKEVLSEEAYYQFTIRRTNQATEEASNPDIAQIETVSCINTFYNKEFDDVTLLQVEIPATENATSLRENKINLNPVSKLITYENGAINYTPSASRKAADALLHMYVDFYGLDPATLNLDELYDIQNSLDAINPALATFDFTFDDIDVSLDERMDAILQVMRSYKWMDGDVYRFVRDEARDYESTLITRRDIVSEDQRDYSITYSPQLLQAYDSVKVEYVDVTTNKKAYIYRTIDTSSPNADAPDVIDGYGNNPKSIQLAGCQEEYNAINRAELEMRKLIYHRWTLTDTVDYSGMLLDKGDMILYAEQYNNSDNFFDGEIRSVSGNIATVSEHIDFVDGETYQVHYTVEDGSTLGPFDISQVEGNCFQFECSSLTNVYVRDSMLGITIQKGSRYVISTYEELDAARWTVIEKEPKGRDVQLTLSNYDDRVYEFDEIQEQS